ncbi:hypothetical protein LS70_009695 [Helicobacter sp. MIT 11-5569]|uniref:hypothetical protein n=1 Tax=Helicobacter sp. MIT 11-5569 TaxID=1548151 RepID=UPI00051F8FE7|nr:hypothetical protein [Helicobacter sp. MIT 11-5569]TLD79714.1 hypothetical protein LS70_009695 [Helicobacter sp. MIT 11-5569]
MQSNAISTNYRPLEIQSDYSVSSERRESHIQALQDKLKEEVGGGYAVEYLPPDSYIQAFSYLFSDTNKHKEIKILHSVASFSFYPETDNNPLSFKNTLEQEESLASKATSQMQDWLLRTHLTNAKTNAIPNTNPKNTFGGYSVDEQGFMGEEFLKAADLPSDYKIHKNILQALNDFYTAPSSEYKSIDLIAGLSKANKEFNALLTEDKNSYTKEEILKMTKGSEGQFDESYFETLLMKDYQNADGTFQKEGIMIMYGINSGALRNAESPYTIKKEMKAMFVPSGSKDKEKTPEEKAKELRDALDEFYRKALESSQKGIENKDKDTSIPNGIIQESRHFKKRVEELEFNQVLEKLEDYSMGGEWIKVRV